MFTREDVKFTREVGVNMWLKSNYVKFTREHNVKVCGTCKHFNGCKYCPVLHVNYRFIEECNYENK